MIKAIVEELQLRSGFITGNIESIYFGGGTPSIINSVQLATIMDRIHDVYNVNSAAEITLEANPEDIDRDKAIELSNLGFNRISLGIQSFDDKVLQDLNRVHTSKQGYNAIHILQDHGLDNISIDLIYGIPKQGILRWQTNLSEVAKLGIPHLSCYALTIEEKTAFGNWLKIGKFKAVTETEYEKEYKLMCNYLTNMGYQHYEVSSFAKPDYVSRHNSAYWHQEPYLGLGPGAHSYNGESRQYNVSNNARYIKAIQNGDLPSEYEKLTNSQKINEYLLTGLRTSIGIDLRKLKDEFNFDLLKTNGIFMRQCVDNKLAIMDKERFILTDDALILADSIIIELMAEEE